MRIGLTIICSLLLLGCLRGQEDLSWEEKQNARDATYQLLTEFQRTVEFRSILKQGLDSSRIADFRKLFENENVDIFDNINPDSVLVNEERKIYKRELRSRKLGEYIREIEANYKNGIKVQILNLVIDYDTDSLLANKSRVLLVRESSAKRNDGLDFASRDTSWLHLVYTDSLKIAKISKIESVSVNPFLECYQDSDLDCVLDYKDGCPDDGNKIEPGNCDCGRKETADCIKTYNEIGLHLGGTSNSMNFGGNIGLLPSSEGEQLELSPIESGGRSLNFGIDFNYFFKPNLAIGTGLFYTSFSATASVNNQMLERNEEEGGDIFKRIVNLDRVAEQANVSYLSIPLLFTFKQTLEDNKNIKIYVQGGPILSIPLRNNAALEGDPKGDFEKVYSQVNGKAIKGDWALTRERTEELTNTDTDSVKDYFDERQEPLAVGLDVTLEANSAINQRASLGWLVKTGVCIALGKDKKTSLSIGAHLQQTSVARSQGADTFDIWKEGDEVGTINSLLGGLDYEKVRLGSYGVSLGLIRQL